MTTSYEQAAITEVRTAVGLSRATITLNNAQIKALPTTQLLDVIAGIPGKVITVISAVYKKDFSHGAYTSLGGDGAEIGFLTGDLGSSCMIANQTNQNTALFTEFFGNAISDVFCTIGPKMFPQGKNTGDNTLNSTLEPGQAGDATPIGAALQLECSNSDGASSFGGGHALNTLVIEILFWIA